MSKKAKSIIVALLAIIVIGGVVGILAGVSDGFKDWQKEVTVSFDSNGGTEVEEVDVEKGEAATAPTAPTRTGYTFEGWYLDGVEYDWTAPVNEDIHLEAVWTAATPTT